MNNQDRQKELIRLAETLKQIKIQLALSEEVWRTKQSELKNCLFNYWEAKNDFSGANLLDEAQLVEAVHRQRAISSIAHKTPRKLRAMLNSPYFGRIDFRGKNSGRESPADQIYIGISTLSDKETGDFLVYDWRAPVAGMFYDFGIGDAWYNCPAGTIEGTISRKRQYKIVNGHMQYMFDTDLKIDDDILQEILAKSVDDKMHTIVNSIQREQNQIIRDEQHRVLFVAGPPGSGKTSVALHRIAFLLYHDRERINEKNILILSPNRLFSDYISNVLPEMGEENVLQMTFQDYNSRSLARLPVKFEDRASHLESLLSSTNTGREESSLRAANISFKSSPGFDQALRDYLRWLETNLVDNYPSLEFRGQLIFAKEEWKQYYAEHFSAMPAGVRLKKIRRVIGERMRPLVYAVRAEKETEIVGRAEEVNERVIKARARLAAKQEFGPLREKIKQLTDLQPLTEYRKLFEDERLVDHSSAKTAFPGQWPSIRQQTLGNLKAGILPYEDIPAFLYFQDSLQGFPVRRDIKHLVVDEAQDYTRLQFRILAALFPNATWTVVGDAAQAIHPFLTPVDFTEVNKIMGRGNSFLFRLTRSYRSTKQIQAFCQAILPKVKVEPIDRPGPLPRLTKVKNNRNLPAAIRKAIDDVHKGGWRSIGIICKNTRQCQELFSALKDHISLNLVVDEDDEFQRGIVVIPSYLAKGLEFDAVLAVNADAVNYAGEEERQVLYIVCTRALHFLILFYIGAPSPFITKIDKTLYSYNNGQ